MRDGAARLTALAAEISSCSRCPDLAESRARAVCGQGSERARVMVVAPFPSEDDEREIPAAAGSSLFTWLSGYLPTLADEGRSSVYVTALVKCVPRTADGLRDALDGEQTSCFPFLSAEMSVITPHFVLPVGRDTCAFLVRRLFGRVSESVLPPAIRVIESPSFGVIPVAGTAELERMAKRERTRYIDQLRGLTARIGL
jgi:uracil-DNA glycosylase family 4